MDGVMGKEEDVVEAVLTCEGDFHDPELQNQIERFRHKLKDLLLTDSKKVQVRKVEPWNSVKVTLTIPKEAAIRLRQLAQNGNEALRQMGVLSVQVQGDSQIALTFLGSNNEQREVVFSSSPVAQVPVTSASGSSVQPQATNSPPVEAVVSLDDLASSPGPSSDEVTRKNIVDYLRQGPHLRQNVALIGSLMGAVGAVSSSSSTSRLSMGQDIPTVSNPSTNSIGMKSHSYRPNNIATVGATAAQYQGSQVAKTFPFKTTGAFHPPVPRFSSSAGQNMAIIDPVMSSNSPQLQQQANGTPPIIRPADISQAPIVSGTGQHGLVSSKNNFSSQVPHTGLNSSIISPSVLPSPPVLPSPSSNYFVDLPPPPPYPHGASSAASPRPNKSGNASSPMLVNLLQTDPSVAAAGMASGNPKKPLTIGEQVASDSPPKKKRKRKQKKPSDELASSPKDFHPGSVVVKTIDSNSNPLSLEQAVTAADTHKPLNSKLDMSSLDLLRENKVSLSIKDIQSDCFISSGIQSDFNKSAIAARTKNSLHIESNRQVDILSSETAAGKIINPYTGQLEPRDSVVDSNLHGLKDLGKTQISAYSATQMLAQRALELNEIAQKSVPQSSPAFLENVHAVQNVSSSTFNSVSLTSITTAAASIVDSGKPSQLSNLKTQLFDSTSSNTTLSLTRSLTQPSIYVGSSPSCQSTQNAKTIEPSVESQSLPSKESCLSAVNKTVGHSFSNGPLIDDRDNGSHMRMEYSETNNKLHVSSSSSDSVISSNLRVGSYSTTSQAILSQPSLTHIVDQKNLVRNNPVSVSNSSMSVSLDIPSIETRLSPLATMSEQGKPSLTDYPPSSHDSQAATSNTDIKVPSSTRITSPSLLNSVPEKHIDSLSSTESPPETKVLSEGDDNSGTAALIEHSRVKIENHDSGVGSSSERSDDTPSEPGDGQSVTDTEENNTKASISQKLVNCKPEPPFGTVDSSITVGYMINASSDHSGKPSSSKAASKKPFVEPVSSAESSGSDISQFYDAHCKSMEKQAGLMAVDQVPLSPNCLSEKGGIGYHPQYGSKVKENGPTKSSFMENRISPKLNGPSSQGSLNSMVAATNELQAKKMKLPQGGINSKGFADSMNEEHREKEAVMEKINRIHHQMQDQKETLSLSPSGLNEIKGAEGTTEKAQQDASLAHRLEGHSEQLYLDLEEIHMKIIGNGASVVTGGGNSVEGKGGNITSIYSKRSSPVNVNMLNHIYASGLPLPRRLTESVQRLVKPLPASEMGISLGLPHSRAYNSKSPVSSSIGTLPKAGAATLSSVNGPHHSTRMTNHSGARSPGASMPRLVPNDQHRLLSGGLDLAGLTNFQIPLGYGVDHVGVSGSSSSVGHLPALSSLSLREDYIVKGDPHSLSVSLHSPSLLRDSQPYSSRMLSQSYPPFKTKDHLANLMQRNHDIQMNHLSKSNEAVQHSFHDSNIDTVTDIQEKGSLQFSVRNHSLLESKGSRLPNQCATEGSSFNHSNKHTDGGSEPSKFSVSTSGSSNLSAFIHSNASSPLMPILQRGQEPPITPSFPSSMPNISSQPPLISLASTEISLCQDDTPNKSATTSAPSTQSQSVPCSSSLTTKISLENPKGNLEVPVAVTHASRLPVLSPMVSGSIPLLQGHTSTSQVQVRGSADFQEHVNNMSDPPKLTKAQSVSSSSSLFSKAGTHSYQINRNIFDTVSAESLPRQQTVTAFPSLSTRVDSVDCERNTNFKDDEFKNCDISLPEQNILDHVIDLDKKAVANPVDSFHKNFPENGSKQHSTVTQKITDLENSKCSKSRQLLSTESSSNTSEPKTIVSTVETKYEKIQGTDLTEMKTVATSQVPHHSWGSNQASMSGIQAPVKEKVSTPDNTLTSSSFVKEVAKSQLILASDRSLSTSSGASSTITTVLGNGNACTSESAADVGESPVSGSPMKEPILETLASALKKNHDSSQQSSHNSFDHHQKTSEKSPASQRPPMIPLTASDISKLEQSMTLQGKMVAIQSNPQIKNVATEPVGRAVSELLDSGCSHSRMTRKRKINTLEGELHDEGNTYAKPIPLEQARLSNIKSKPPEGIVNRWDKLSGKEKETDPVETGSILTKTAVGSSVDKIETVNANLEHKDPIAKISADLEKNQERRRHRSITTSSQSDDGHSHRSSSNESRDCTSPSLRDGRSNKTVSSISDKDGRTPRGSGSTAGPGQQREPKFHHRTYPGSERDAQSKENRSHRVPSHHSSEDARHTQVDWSEDHSGEDKDKMKLPGAKVLTPGDKFSSPDGKDDGQKKAQRVKRQFYAYVPEKSLDQTYFDTPILSGRTRSKNKPLEEETAAVIGGASAPSTADSQAAQSVASSTVPVTGQSVGYGKHAGDSGALSVADAGTGGKRPTRSVRTKDSPHEQNPNKRRKVQQQR
ncbi:hypothetical protein EGW08_003657 [Elysia chlorotica]|uniref:Nuclear receptor coactivator 6 TRADD-N domain-containing protein n=1 Tax=Elysia chlorotica TaxID=188477 RepID=A0A433U3Z6_ELYCH|nr:hypothetical protein EGW08_003657 [Elysia chlorotica]